MAKAKTPIKTPSPTKSASASIFTVAAETGALEAGTKAVGAASLQKGFGFTPNDDLMFALGFPHMYLLIPDDGVDPVEEASTIALHSTKLESFYHRSTATRLARGLAYYPFSGASPPSLNDFVLTEIKRDDPITADEARALVGTALGGKDQVASINAKGAVMIIEALLGTTLAADALITALENVKHANWAGRGYLYLQFVVLLRFMALRLDAAQSKAILGRAAAHATALKLDETQSKAVGLALFQGKSQEDLGDTLMQPLIAGSPAFVLKSLDARVAAKLIGIPDPRDVLLADDEAYRRILAQWPVCKDRVIPATMLHELIVQRFGRVQSPHTVKLMLEMSLKSKVKPLARSWFDDFAAYAKPHLDALASDGPLAKEAKTLLAKLG